MAGLASAATKVWTPQDPAAAANGYSDWTWTNGTLTNWTIAGIPTGIPTAVDKAVMNNGLLAECRVTSTVVCASLAQGDGGTAGSVIRIVDGGTLYTPAGGEWSAVGYNQPATMIVEEGGALETCNRFGVGWFTATGQSQLLVEGGYVKVGAFAAGNLQLGSDGDGGTTAHKGYVNVTNGGLIEVNGGLQFNNNDGSNINLEFGSIVFNTDVKALLDTRIGAGKVKGFGGQTTPTAVYAGGKTTLTAPDPMNRAPVYTTLLPGSKTLSWTNLTPIPPADPNNTWVDVYFGTDPNVVLNPKVVSKGKNVTSVAVAAPLVTEPTTYYWRVDSYRHGDPALVPGDPNAGLVTPFYVTANLPPSVVIETPPTVTWINQPIQLDSTLTDDGNSAVTYLWTSDDPNAVFSPSATVADPTVTVDWKTGWFTVTVTVDDGFNPPVSSQGFLDEILRHYCATDACEAATDEALNLDATYRGDVVLDCKGNLTDFALYAQNWLNNYQLTAPVPN
jgi:hypothetical protein